MKLWQKIFLLTLALVIIVVNTTSLVLLSTNHSLAVEREYQNALSQHSQLVANIMDTVVVTEITENKVSLTDAEVFAIAMNAVRNRRNDPSMRPSLFRDGTLAYPSSFSRGVLPEAERALLSEPDYSSMIIDDNERTYLLIVTTTTLAEHSYQMVSFTDLTSTYESLREGLNRVRIIGIVSALIIAGLLVMLVRALLAPLRDLSKTTGRIASGDLDTRAKITSHDEVAEVARDFNIMADSIEHNVAKLEELAESRRIFIGNLAHEMKTPLTSILGFADILRIKREVSDEDRINYANIIVSETKRLQGLSGKLMELLTLGNLSLTPILTDVRELFGELAATLAPIIKNHELELTVEEPPDVTYVNVDREMIKSLIFNLIDNSIKASAPHGKIFLRATIENASENAAENNRVTLSVVDEGIGIPEEQIPLLVEPFYSLDKARTRKHGGAGLGLALCSEIALAHGSKLRIESTLGLGTTVSFTLDEVRING